VNEAPAQTASNTSLGIGLIRRGEPAYRRTAVALVCAGASIFGLLYCTQPLLPLLARDFRLGAAGASLAVTAATGALAVGLVASGLFAGRVGGKTLMSLSLFSAAALTLLAAIAPAWPLLVALRAATGFVLAAAPAAAMAHVAEEVDPSAVGPAMGLYVASTALGGMAGRLGSGLAADRLGWRGALALTAGFGVIAAVGFLVSLPPPRRRPAARGRPGVAGGMVAAALRDAPLRWLYLEAFLLMGVFVSLYNDLAFRLAAAPYALSQGWIAAIFSLYLLGIGASTLAGEAVGRLGERRVLPIALVLMAAGVGLTAAAPLALVVAGTGLATVGFFAAHATASSWVGRRAGALPGSPRGAAASAYLVSYYSGSSLLGTLGALAWSWARWSAVTAFGLTVSLAALVIAIRLGLAASPTSVSET
jgi:MFS transporter, YNFM family, putative membrane transport protein